MAAVAVAAIAAAVILLIAGPGGHSAHPTAQPLRSASPAAALDPRRDVVVAAEYLGISRAQLRSEMLAGNTLASIADASKGKSANGLIEALLESRSAAIKRALARGRISKQAAAVRVGRLRRRARALVYRPASGGLINLSVVAAYLGLAPARILAQERSPRSLANLAAATPGRSAGGLIGALLSARRAQLSAAVAAGTLTGARERALLAVLRLRISTAVNR